MWLALMAVVSQRVDATLDPEARRLDGRTSIAVTNPTGAPLDRVYVWLYPNRFAQPPAALDDVNEHWIYPDAFDPGGMEIAPGGAVELRDHARAGPRTLAALALPAPVPPGGTARLELAFRVRIPARYGPFGCAEGVCTLAGGWHPMVAFLDELGWDLDARPATADVDVRVRSPWPTLIGGARAAEAQLRGVFEVPLVAFERAHAAQRACGGVEVSYTSRRRRPPPHRVRLPYGVEDFHALGLAAACDATAMLVELGIPAAGTLSLVEVPLRHELAQAHGSVVLVSDRAWRIFPADRFRKFHTFQVVRAVYAALMERRLAAHEAPRDLAWAPDAIASYLVDLYTVRAYRRHEFARDLLRYFGFVPEIDSLMYAPKVAFTSAYFGAVEEADPWRDDLRRFAGDLPRGKRVYEKLRDLLEGRVVGAMRLTVTGVPLRAAAARAAGADLGWFFAQWLGPYPPGDVRIAAVESEERAGGFEHRVRAAKRGGAVEPVVLWARDGAGEEVRLRWDGRGAEHVYAFRTRAPLDVVHLDPRERLVERWPGVHDDLRLDNRRPARLKWVWTDLAALLDVTQESVAARATFSLRRVYDLRNNVVVGAFRTPVEDFGGVLGYGRAFGVQADASRLTGFGFATLFAARLSEDFARAAGEEPRPGTRMGGTVGVGYDDRPWGLDPHRGRAARLAFTPSLTARDGGGELATYALRGDAAKFVRVAPGHVLAAQVAADSVFGDVRVPAQLASAGLVGYEPDELLGRGAASARLEYRHLLVGGLDWNLAQLHRARGLGGAVFLGGATLADCDAWPDGAFSADATFFNAGYSLRAFFDELGVYQALMRIDLGVPLVRRERSCLGRSVPPARRAPFGLIVAFGPPF